ncbi:unnamed protein product [Polarella glacialis]|uniref:Uncharacterized protein n=1 Tax=Polarella glacialis TaxID=89957 RepID=A0A813KFZ8_POLGL|nr:unnamed protein product [Polarella glacialis]
MERRQERSRGMRSMTCSELRELDQVVAIVRQLKKDPEAAAPLGSHHDQCLISSASGQSGGSLDDVKTFQLMMSSDNKRLLGTASK